MCGRYALYGPIVVATLAIAIIVCNSTVTNAGALALDGRGPDGLLEEIDHKGPRQVIAEIETQGDAALDRVSEHIESGDPRWLEVARRLRRRCCHRGGLGLLRSSSSAYRASGGTLPYRARLRSG
jgi:hypothetical protein